MAGIGIVSLFANSCLNNGPSQQELMGEWKSFKARFEERCSEHLGKTTFNFTDVKVGGTSVSGADATVIFDATYTANYDPGFFGEPCNTIDLKTGTGKHVTYTVTFKKFDTGWKYVWGFPI